VSGFGLNWVLVRTQCAGRNQTGIEVWMAQGTPTGSTPVTATFASAPLNAAIAVSRYSGVNGTSPIGNVVSGNTMGGGGACSGGTDTSSYSFTLPTPVARAAVYGGVTMRNRTHTPGPGYAERAEIAQGSIGDIVSVAVEDQGVTAASMILNGSFSSTTDWAVVGIEIRP
jgi:hypothetical protein